MLLKLLLVVAPVIVKAFGVTVAFAYTVVTAVKFPAEFVVPVFVLLIALAYAPTVVVAKMLVVVVIVIEPPMPSV